MTYEQAAYFKLLLLCGYADELQRYIENALAEQDPLSNVILELSTAGSDNKKVLSVLNEYLRHADADVDWVHAVFEMVMEFLKKAHDDMSMKKLTDLMYQLAVHTDQYDNEPWKTMYHMGILFDEAEAGYIDKADYRKKLESFIKEGICLSEYPSALPKESFMKRVLRWLRGAHEGCTP